MIRNFKSIYGKPKDVIFIIGDYDKGQNNMRGKEPVICKKFRLIFKNSGYKTYLINEYKTSKTCNGCHGELETFFKRESCKPKDKKKEITLHGLLRCTNAKHKCEIIHNRDKNAVQNMLNIVENVFRDGCRPKIFCRDSQVPHT
jgi:hypothetical protein